MSESALSAAVANALSGTTDSLTDLVYSAIGEAAYYTADYRRWQRVLQLLRGTNKLRVYKDGALTFGVRAGEFVDNLLTISYAGSTAQALTDNATNYIYLTVSGGAAVLNKNTTGFPSASVTTHLPLATIVTASAAYAVDNIDDRRSASLYQTLAPVSAGDPTAAPYLVVAANDAGARITGTADYVCDGTADNVDIQAAIDDLPNAGGRVFCAGPTFNIAATITVPDNVILEFERGSTVNVTGTGTGLTQISIGSIGSSPVLWRVAIVNSDTTTSGAGNTGITIRGLYMNYSGAKSANDNWLGVLLHHCSYSTLEDCTAYNVVTGVNTAGGYRAHGFAVSNCTNCTIVRCRGTYCGYEGFKIGGSSSYIICADCMGDNNGVHDLEVSGFNVSADPQHVLVIGFRGTNDIDVHGTSGNSPACKYVTFVDCHTQSASIIGKVDYISMIRPVIVGSSTERIRIGMGSTGDGGNPTNILIQGAMIDKTSAVSGNRIAIEIGADKAGGTISDITVSDCHFYNGFVEFTGVTSANVTRVHFDANTFTAMNDRYAINATMSSSGGLTNLKATNNIYDGAGSSSWAFLRFQLTSTGSVQDVRAIGNQYTGTYTTGTNSSDFISASSTSTGTTSRVVASNNTISAGGAVVKSADVRLTDVTLENNKVITCKYGLSGPMAGVHLEGNDFDAFGTSFSTGTPTDVTVRGNRGYVTNNSGTATILYGSANTEVTVTHGLGITPVAANIHVTPTGTLLNASFWWVDNITSTTFDINVNADPGQNVPFAWHVRD